MQFAASVDSLDSGPSCSEPIAISSSAPTVPVDSQKEPLSPVSERYRLKKFHLQQKYDYIYMSNNRLRNRLYHIKKEINHLKRLKRVLCQRLFTFRDPFMDSCLEIPDNDPTSPTIERISSDATGKPSGSSKKKKAAEAKRVNQRRSERRWAAENLRYQIGSYALIWSQFKADSLEIFMVFQQVNEVSSMVEIAKNSVISIIDSVITESHEERVRANQNSSGQKTPQQSPNVPALGEVMRNEAGIEGVSEDCEPVIERMLRASSIDHLLPVDPDSDTNNVLTGFGENLEENFMAED
uniref:BHLH domain-containing protein n=1 Tax=Loa loa TaxID=7209 RepID=A0A1I7W5T6_LOALO